MPTQHTRADERRLHRHYAKSRTLGYLRRAPLHDRLDRHAVEGRPPLVVVGPEGSGKSALVAAWCEEVRSRDDAPLVIEHYIGAVPGQSVPDIVRSILLEIADLFDVKLSPPQAPDALAGALSSWLWYVRSPTILCIDGLDEIEGDDERLDWIPEKLPEDLRLVLSSRGGRFASTIEERGFSRLEVVPFSVPERRILVRRFITERRAELTSDQQRRVADDEGSAVPLLLRTRLEEVRLHRPDETTQQRLADLLEADSIDAVYRRVLMRLEEEFGTELPRQAVSLLRISATGLTDEELADLLQADADRIPSLLDRLQAYLLSVDERRALYHRSFARVCEEYWQDSVDDSGLRTSIADYFIDRPYSPRIVREVLDQERRIDDAPRLEALARNLRFVLEARRSAQYDLLRTLRLLDDRADLGELFTKAVASLDPSSTNLSRTDALLACGRILSDLGRKEEALGLWEEGLAIAIDEEDIQFSAQLSQAIGIVLSERGELEQAERMLQRARSSFADLSDVNQSASCTNSLGAVAFYRGDLERAGDLFREAQAAYASVGNSLEIARTAGNIGAVEISLGRIDEAIDSMSRMLSEAEALGDVRMEAEACSNLAQAYQEKREIDRALEYAKRSLGLVEAIGNRRQIGFGCSAIAGILNRLHQFERGLEFGNRFLQIAEETNDERNKSQALSTIGYSLLYTGHAERAAECFEEGVMIAEKIGDERLAVTKEQNLAYLALFCGDAERAERLFSKSERRARVSGFDREELAARYGVLHARIYCALDERVVEGLALVEEQATEFDDTEIIVGARGYRGVALARLERFDEALRLLDDGIDRLADEPLTFDRSIWILTRAEIIDRVRDSAGRREQAYAAVREVAESRVVEFRIDLARRVERLLQFAEEQE